MRRRLIDSYRRCTCSHIAAMHHFDPEIGSTGCRECEECQGFMARAHKVADRGKEGTVMGMLTRMLIPRSVRRAAHPVRTVKRAVTPRPVKRVRRAMHPVSNAKYAVERALVTRWRRRG